MWFSKQEKDFFSNLVDVYIKNKKRFPSLENLAAEHSNDPAGTLLRWVLLDKEVRKSYSEFLIEKFDEMISSKSSVKTRVIIRDSYLANKDLFTEFFIMNLDRSCTTNPSFNEIWKKIRTLIVDCADRVVWNMESGKKYSKFSSSVADSFFSYVKTFFPYYEHIGVIVRKSSN